jgi:hypothetical protein
MPVGGFARVCSFLKRIITAINSPRLSWHCPLSSVDTLHRKSNSIQFTNVVSYKTVNTKHIGLTMFGNFGRGIQRTGTGKHTCVNRTIITGSNYPSVKNYLLLGLDFALMGNWQCGTVTHA